MIKVVYCNSVFCDIYDPVFPDTCGTIFEKFQEIIHFSACRRYNFNNPVWCAFTSFIIRNYIKQHKGTCEVLPAPFAVYLDEINNTYVEPDISVICDPNKLDDKGCKRIRL